MSNETVNSAGSVTVVFRYDDSSAISSLQLELDFVKVFAEAGVQSTIGVTPFINGASLPLEKVKFYFETHSKGLSEIALHGNNHKLSNFTKKDGEFANLPYPQQLLKISSAKNELEQILADKLYTFIPPWNAYDINTVKILQDLNFTCLSASLRGPFFSESTITYLPATCLFGELQELVRIAMFFKSLNPCIVVLLHDFDFIESGSEAGWMTIEALSSTIKDLLYRGVRILSLNQLANDWHNNNSEIFKPYQKWNKYFQYCPFSFRYFLGGQILWRGYNSRMPFFTIWFYQTLVTVMRIYNKVRVKYARYTVYVK